VGNSNGAVASLTVANFTCLTLTSQQGSARNPWPSAVLQQALSGVRLVSANPDSEQVCADTAKPSEVKPMSKANTIETKGFRKRMVQKYGKTGGENKMSVGRERYHRNVFHELVYIVATLECHYSFESPVAIASWESFARPAFM
jgi:hypothetical protein